MIEKEIFAYYGRAIYMAQCVEKELMNHLIFPYLEVGITKTRVDDLIQEKSKLTVGQLKRELKDLDLDSGLKERVDKFHETRDFLAHSFWWERAVEFYRPDLQPKLIVELNEYTEEFEALNEELSGHWEEVLKRYNLNLDDIIEETISNGRTEPFNEVRKMSKNETIIDLFSYRINNGKGLIPVFQLEDLSYCTLCDVGLVPIDIENVKGERVELDILNGIFPIYQFQPRPKVESPWNYTLDLKKKGLKLIVTRIGNAEPFKWRIE
ncbi:hypothetical protein V6R21_20055 [Limibacter armeniacum]|uniref:hypothetical protein n=1 Tax=Limibacter armeniacum TaxID=466084 RepID=UPI002FE671D4